jgi:hypothetical protein
MHDLAETLIMSMYEIIKEAIPFIACVAGTLLGVKGRM